MAACRVPGVPWIASKILETRIPIVAPIVNTVLHSTFVGGTTCTEALKTCSNAWSPEKVRPMLDFAAEANNGRHPDKVVEILHQSIDAAASHQSVVIIKPSALLEDAATKEDVWHQPEAVQRLERRLVDLAKHARDANVVLMVDAEQFHTLDATRDVVRSLQREFNQCDRAVVYGTTQAYLRRSRDDVLDDLSDATVHNYSLGVKLVRGAYLEEERRRHAPMSPCFATLQETTRCYSDVTDMLLNAIASPAMSSPHVVFATHNRNSILHAVAGMRDRQLLINDRVPHVSFAQLWGMADEVTFALAHDAVLKNNCGVFKYVPWGSPRDTALFLARRASENSMGTWAVDDIQAMVRELCSRVFFVNRLQ